MSQQNINNYIQLYLGCKICVFKWDEMYKIVNYNNARNVMNIVVLILVRF